MYAVWQALRWDLRSRWRPLLALAILLGVLGGAVLACAAGARRTDTAYGRLLNWAHAAQVQLVAGYSGDRLPPPQYYQAADAYYRAVRKLPGVEAVSESLFDDAVLPTAGGRLSQTSVTALASPDNSAGASVDRVKILAGHLWRPTDPHAVMVDQMLAQAYHLRPGSTFRLAVVPNGKGGNPDPGQAVIIRETVTAVVAFDNQIVPATTANAVPTVLLSPPFARSALARDASYGTQLSVTLRPGVSLPRFTAAAADLATRIPIMKNYGVVLATPLTDQQAATQRAIRPQAVALAVFAVLAGLILLTVVCQLLSRQLTLDAVDYPVMRAMGMTPGQLTGLSVARIALVTVSGGVLAVIEAIVGSPMMPIGPARVAEPQPGIAADMAILGPGLALLVLLPLALTGPAAWRSASRPPGSPRALMSSHSRRQAGAAGVLPAGGSITRRLGIRMALEPGYGRTAVPVRSALVGTIIAVAATVAALVFNSSLVHLVDTPAEFGQNWQAKLDFGFGGLTKQLITKVAALQPGLTGYAAGDYGQISVNGNVVPAIGMDAFRGGGYVTMISGHAPGAPDQIAFGARTMRALHLKVGQRVRVVTTGVAGNGPSVRAVSRTMTIVGTAVLASFGEGTIVATDLGSGAVVSNAVLSAPDRPLGCVTDCYNFVVARYRAGFSLQTATANLVATTKRLGCPPGSCAVTSSQQPSDVRNLSRVRDTPLALGLVLALLAIGTLAHVLVTSVRRRRRDFAVLKVLGMERADILRIVGWQAAAISVAALGVGLPVGVVAGRWVWTLFAGSAGAPDAAVISAAELAIILPVTLILAGLVAAVPGRAAARIRPALALRAE